MEFYNVKGTQERMLVRYELTTEFHDQTTYVGPNLDLSDQPFLYREKAVGFVPFPRVLRRVEVLRPITLTEQSLSKLFMDWILVSKVLMIRTKELVGRSSDEDLAIGITTALSRKYSGGSRESSVLIENQ